MIWELLIASAYSLSLAGLCTLIGYRLGLSQASQINKSTLSETISLAQSRSLSPVLRPKSSALKSMTPIERSQEESKEIRERIENLLK